MFEENYGNSQHGFRRGSSTTTAIVNIIDAALKSFDQQTTSGTAIISLDLSKAFDCLDHDLLTDTLMQRGFPHGLVTWLRNYLTSRSASVKVGDRFSKEYEIHRGVPQGTVLGPLLFNTFVSDLETSNNDTTIIKYADDINIVINFTEKDPQSIKRKIEREVTHAMSWCKNKKMVLNTEKSSCLLNFRKKQYHPNSLPLPEKDSVKLLGIRLNNSLDWSSHIDEMYRKANQRFHVLKQIKPLVSAEDLHKIYEAYIRSILDYCSPAFVKLNRCLNDRLQKVDNRAHRIIFHEDQNRTCPCTKNNIATRREQMSLKLFFNIEKNKSHPLHSLIPKRLKYTNHFNVQFCRTQKRQHSFIHYTTQLVNGNIQKE